jgi:hypothetical protein
MQFFYSETPCSTLQELAGWYDELDAQERISLCSIPIVNWNHDTNRS